MNVSGHFPLVGDDEIITDPPRSMNLYDDRDLISNIQGSYEEPQFTADSRQFSASTYPQDSSPVRQRNYMTNIPVKKPTNKEEKSPGQLAREEARQDLKRKRSAPYLSQNKPFKGKELPKPQPDKRDANQQQLSRLTAAANRLEQEDYIVAELAPSYQPPQNEPVTGKKNSYDFLKTSRVYNHEGSQKPKDKKRAQELNLMRFEQKDNL